MKHILLVSLFLLSLSCNKSIQRENVMVVAHRGASGYLPEHTLESASLAHGWNVDYLEPDVVVTKDNELVILHDPHLDTTTNVSELYPTRKRGDGRFYVVDFTLSEIKKLSVHERQNLETGNNHFEKRFPKKKSHFEVPTLREFIELVQGLNRSRNKKIGIIPEIKNPEFHEKEGKDITKLTIELLREYGYEENNQAIIQCFYPPTLKRLKEEFHTKIPLFLLIADNSWDESSVDYEQLQTEESLKEVATYAYGIGPWLPQVIKDGKPTQLTTLAHKYGLKVIPYTHRVEEIPPKFSSEREYFDTLFQKAKIDGLFSDFADRVLLYLE